MDYQLENLGEDRFQEFCQALLVREYNNIQCFPINQPDGGRDALSFIAPDSNSFIVFQVKFVRKPLAVSDVHKWLVATIEREAPKVEELITRGAKN